MWIGVISDTRGQVLEQARDLFEGVDYILHCGNVGSASVLEELSLVAPITGVLGTLDDPEDYPLQKVLYKKWFEVGIYLRHDIGDPLNLTQEMKDEFAKEDPEVVLFGAGGDSFNNRVENRLFLNPGGCGLLLDEGVRSVGLLEIEGQSVRAEVVPIEDIH